MADRSLVARLKADVAGFKSSMREAQASTKAVGAEASKASKEAVAAFNSQEAVAKRASDRQIAQLRAQEEENAKAALAAEKYGKVTASVTSHQEGLSTVARGLAGIGVAAIAGVGTAVTTAANFDQAMSDVVATGDDARKNQDALRDSAIEWGKKTKFSASEAAGGIEAMLKAGVSATDIIGKGNKGGLAGALNLAAAGGISVQSAAEDAATAMTQFHLAGKDVPHLADLLAAGAGKAQGEVGDLAQALNQSGLVASQFGLSIDDTVGTLSAFASAGLLGSDAGTSFKTMLLQLANPSQQSRALMDKLGISAYNAQGKFIGIANLAQQLHDKLHNLTQAQRDQALGQIFGNDAIRAANVLYNQGAKGIDKWISKVNDQGYAADVAKTKMDNLSGDLEQLRGSLETAFIGAGEGQQGFLRKGVQGVTDLVNAYIDLPDGVKTGVTGTVAALGLISLGGAGVIKVLQGAAAIKKAYTDLGLARAATAIKGLAASATSITAIGLAAGPAAVALGLGAAALYKWEQKQADIKQSAAGFDDVLDGMTGKINENTAALNKNVRQQAIKQLNDAGAYRAAAQLGISYNDVTQAALNNTAAQKRVADATGNAIGKQREGSLSAAGYATANKVAGAATDENASAARKLDDVLGTTRSGLAKSVQKHNDYARATKQAATATQESAQANADALPSLDDLTNAEGKLDKALQSVINKFTILSKGALDQEQANDAWKQSLADLTKQATSTASTEDRVASAQRAVALAEQRLTELRKSGHATRSQLLSAENSLQNARDRLATATDAESKATAANSKSLSQNTQAGRDNRAKVVAAIQAMNDKVTADVKSAGATGNATKATRVATSETEKYRKELIQAAVKAGYSRGEVKKMVDQMLLTPSQIRTEINTPGVMQAMSNLDDLKRKVQAVPSETRKLRYEVTAGGTVVHFKGGGKAMFAGGGYTGPGGKYEYAGDVHRGEVVFDQEAVSAAGGPHRLDGYRKALKSGQAAPPPQYWSGGIVGRNIDLDVQMPNAAGPMSKWLANTSNLISQATAKGVKDAIGSSFIGGPGGGAIPLGGSGLVHWNGGTFTENFANHLKNAYAMHPFFIYQGGWNPGGVAASGSTHDKDAVDIGPANLTNLHDLRVNGLAAWIRTPAEGFIYHIHGVPLPGAGSPSPSAAWQAQDYLRGGNGLWTGTNSATTGWHKMSEKGAELVIEPQWKHLSGGQQVFTAQQTAALLSGGGKQPVIINFYAPMDRRGAAREIKQLLEEDGRFTVGVGRG